MVKVVFWRAEGNVLFTASMSSSKMCRALATNVDCIVRDENADPCMAILPMNVTLSKTTRMSLVFCGDTSRCLQAQELGQASHGGRSRRYDVRLESI